MSNFVTESIRETAIRHSTGRRGFARIRKRFRHKDPDAAGCTERRSRFLILGRDPSRAHCPSLCLSNLKERQNVGFYYVFSIGHKSLPLLRFWDILATHPPYGHVSDIVLKGHRNLTDMFRTCLFENGFFPNLTQSPRDADPREPENDLRDRQRVMYVRADNSPQDS